MSSPDGEEESTSFDDVELGNGDTLAERLDEVDLEEDETVSLAEIREQLDL